MRLYTIGFTGKSAETFFGLLKANGVNLIVDIRLRPDGQLSGFAKKGDFPFFLRELVDCGYLHLPILAPEDEILKGYREDKNWNRYVERFEKMMDERGIPDTLNRSMFETQACCLLCSEAAPDRCHRGLIAERLSKNWNGVEIIHLT